MNVLVFTNSIGGLYNFRKEVILAIVAAGYEVYISVPDCDSRAVFFEANGCHIIQTNLNRRGTNPLSDIKLMLTYRKYIKQFRPIVILTYTIKPNVYGGIAARLCKIPQLANVTGLGDSIENDGWLKKLTVSLYRIGLMKARRIFFQNEENRNICIKYGIASKESLLLPGSGVNLIHHTFKTYPQQEDVIRFLFIGRLLKDKGIEEYYAAARCVKQKYPNTEFEILGKCDDEIQKERLDYFVKEGVVVYLGVTTDVRPYIEKVHCTIMPSYHEGMSNVNLESAANGRPVITTNVPGCRETVDDGITGFLVKVKDTQSLIGVLRSF